MARFAPLRLGTIRGVTISLHWSFALVVGVVLYWLVTQGPLAIVLGASLVGLVLLHEAGHVFVAMRRGRHVESVTLGVMFGYVVYDATSDRTDELAIASAGVAAQLIVLIPAALFLTLFGATPYPALNIPLFVFSGLSAFTVLVNLLPAHPLDGATIWRGGVRSTWSVLWSSAVSHRRSPDRGLGERTRKMRFVPALRYAVAIVRHEIRKLAGAKAPDE